MEIEKLTKENFKKFIKNENAIIDFWAPWCNPCKMMAPEFESAFKSLNNKTKFGKINIDENQNIAEEFDVMSIPTLIFFKDGREVDRLIGLKSKDEIIEKADDLF
jgi:thioredoxin 1